jgi:Zn-finger nucleic acid-binding protein
MNCPICDVELKMSERQGIEIDYCPKCRGVWLDRGELDKIIERSASFAGPHHSGDSLYEDTNYEQHEHWGKSRPRKKRRGSFLEELFEFGD